VTATAEENPLLEGLRLRRRPDPCILVIFGASGDLTTKKLMPALYSLAFRNLLPEKFGIVGAARSDETDDAFRERMKQAVKDHARDPFHEEVWERLAPGMRYATLDFADNKGEDELRDELNELDKTMGIGGNRVYYFAVPPSAISTLVKEIAERRAAEGWVRLIIEKPFGHDLESAKALNAEIQEHFSEGEVFRIDHYLGKETVQNMLALRFANGSSSTTCRSPSPSRSGSKVAPATTSRQARSATSSRTTSSSCSRSRRWSRRSTSRPTPFATRR
jgi:glucose-6-phosphate 1-dehydrogenase